MHAAPPSADRPSPGMEMDAAWNAFAGEALGAWTCAWDVWAGYLGRLAAASGPLDVLEAGALLSLESADIWSRAAATRLGGLRTPLLSDA